jgi:hypothetical protein
MASIWRLFSSASSASKPVHLSESFSNKSSIMDTKSDVNHVEHLERDSLDVIQVSKSKVEVSGTVKLTEGKTVFIPTPTADPQGENLSTARPPIKVLT